MSTKRTPLFAVRYIALQCDLAALKVINEEDWNARSIARRKFDNLVELLCLAFSLGAASAIRKARS